MFGERWSELDAFSKCVLISVALGLATVFAIGPYAALIVFAVALFLCASNAGVRAKKAEAAAPKPKPAAAAPAAPTARAAAPAVKPAPHADAPVMLSAPAGNGPDDLKMLRGVGPKLEGILNEMGFYHFDQIATWTPAQIAWVDGALEGVNRGRASRDDWVAQAKTLATGALTEFAKRVEAGEVPTSQ